MDGLRAGGTNYATFQSGHNYAPAPVSSPATYASRLSQLMPRLSAVSGLAMNLLGTGLQYKALIRQGEYEESAAKYNATLAEFAGQDEARRRRLIARQTVSSQFTQMAGKSGVLAEEGGWLEVLAYNAGQYEMDAVNAEIEARNSAALWRNRGQVAKAESKQLAGASLIAGLSNFSTTLARVR